MRELIKFSATWCGPCKTQKKIMEGLDLGIELKEVDVDEQPELASQYNIRGVPTLVLIEDDKEVKRHSGILQVKQLEEFVKW
jgi:thioredoxin 1